MSTETIASALVADTLDGWHYANGFLCAHDASTGSLKQIGKMSLAAAAQYVADDGDDGEPPEWFTRRRRGGAR